MSNNQELNPDGNSISLKDLEDYAKKTGEIQKQKAKQSEKKVAEYFESINKPTGTVDDQQLKASVYFKSKFASTVSPKEIDYALTKRIFWDYYRNLITIRTGIQKPTIDGNMQKIMKGLVNWIVNDKDGDFPPDKSLYIYSELGVGKSTMIEALQLVVNFYKDSFGWKNKYFDFVSMDELFLQTYTKQSLDQIGRLAKGGFCLDELRGKHLVYKHFGQEFEILSDILIARYNLWRRDKTVTIITSNVSSDNLVKAFEHDQRLVDRLKEQYTFVMMKGENKRNPKFRL